jgi:choline dehydrogenase-like flavoprotein
MSRSCRLETGKKGLMGERLYDAIVVGSGAAGSIAVKELTEKGMNVLLLEAGPYLGPDDFKLPPEGVAAEKEIDSLGRIRAALHGQQIQARATFFNERHSHLFVNDRLNPYTTPRDDFFLWLRGRQLGGRLHSYGRVLFRMSDYDFKAASRDGLGFDWPISYRDLEAYYDRVEEFLGVFGTAEGIPQLPDGKYLKAPRLTRLEEEFKARIESAWPNRKVINWRYAAPNLKRIPLGIQAAMATGRLEIRADAVVRQITIDPQTGKARGVTYIDRITRQEQRVSGKVVVLCASAIESLRLLLNSACAKHPEGVGNSSGLLGRFFMDQTTSVIFGSVPGSTGWECDDSVPQDPYYAPAGGFYIPRFQNLDRRTHPKIARGFAYQGVIGRGFVPEDRASVFGMMGFGETLPQRENCITLNRNRKDAWGVPVAHICCAVGEHEKELMREQVQCSREMVAECGYEVEFAGSALGLDKPREAMKEADWLNRWLFRRSFKKSLAMGSAIHECGGARMGEDPATSVLNPFNQCWDVKNLFVTDASSFVSNGCAGPTLTIMALTARACDYVAREYSRGNL